MSSLLYQKDNKRRKRTVNKSKSIFVTALMAVMLAAIVVGLYSIQYRAFMIFFGLLGTYGFISVAVSFCHWLEREAPLAPAQATKSVRGEPVEFVPTSEYFGTYEQIKKEMEDEQA